MTRRYSAEYKNLQPYVVEDIRKIIDAVVISGGGGGGTVPQHALADLAKHSGELAQTQAPWSATKVELSNHAALPDVHHAKLHNLTDAAHHQITASKWGIVGAAAADNVPGILTPLADVTGATKEAILKSDAGGYLNLVRLVLTDRLRSPLIDTASGDMSITPAGDLTLNPGGGEVFFQGADTLRSSAWTPGLLGVGWGIQERAAGKSHLDIRSIYTDELIATTFTADQVRVRMGSDWLGESLAIAARDNSDAKVTIPNVGSSVRIYVENAPEVTGQIFDANEHVLIKTINRSSGLVIRETWGQVSSYLSETGNRQSYLWTTTSGGGNFTLEPGTALVGFGVSGGSYIYRTVIEAGRGPYERFATWSGNPYTPANRVSRVEVGDIKNAVGDSTTRYGIGAGNNLALTPSTGFSGFTADSVYGFQLYNAAQYLYQSGALVGALTPTQGLNLLAYTSLTPPDEVRQIGWWSAMPAAGTAIADMFGANYLSGANANDRFVLAVKRSGQWSNAIQLTAYNNSYATQAELTLQSWSAASGTPSSAYIQAQDIVFSTTPKVGVPGLGDAIWHAGNTPKSASGNRWGVMPLVDATGVIEVGKYVDFHYTDGDTSDYGIRLTADSGLLVCSSILGGVSLHSNTGYVLSDNAFQFVNNAGSLTAQVRAGSLLVDSSYATDHISRVPTNGIYSLGPVHIGSSYGSTYALDVGGEVRVTGAIRTDTALSLLPVSTPAASATYVILFLDSADGKLKYRLRSGDGGTVRTLSYT